MGKGLRFVVAVVGAITLISAALAWQTPANTNADDPLAVVRDAKPTYLKGNLHTHSLWSDGDDFPEMIADWYKNHGYQFLALTDHNVIAEGERWIDAGAEKSTRQTALRKYLARFGDNWVEQRQKADKGQVRLKPLREFRSLLEDAGRFLLIPAEEITHRFAKAPVHINAINLRDAIQPVSGPSVAETMSVNLRTVADQQKRTGWRMLAFLNHPNFGWGIRAEDMTLTEGLRYFEVHNGHPSVRNYGDETHPGSERMWDIVLSLRLGKHHLPAVFGLATDDAHAYHVYGPGKTNPGRAWIMVRTMHLTAEAILQGLETGDFYATTGVALNDVRREGNEIKLAIQPSNGVSYKTQFIATLRDAVLESEPRLDKEGKPLEVTRVYSADIGKVVGESTDLNPRYRFTGNELYVRAKVISSKSHPNPYQKGDMEVAWTQPFIP